MKRLCFVIVASWICFVISPFVPSQDDVALAGTKITYEPFVSTLYPYRLLQPSSFRHVVLVDLNGHMVDYFYPALGSSVTNVNIFEDEHGEMRKVKELIPSLPGENRLVIVERVDHFFTGKLSEVDQAITTWLTKQVPALKK